MISSGAIAVAVPFRLVLAAVASPGGNRYASWSDGFVGTSAARASSANQIVLGAAWRTTFLPDSYGTTATGTATANWKGQIEAFRP